MLSTTLISTNITERRKMQHTSERLTDAELKYSALSNQL